MYQPNATINKLDAEANAQLFNGLIVIAGLIICAALWVKLCSNGSIPDGIKLAPKPPLTPANAAAIPASGWRPAA